MKRAKIKKIKLLLKIKYYYYYYYDHFTCWILFSVSTCAIAVIMCPGVYPSDTLANELMSNPSLTCPPCFSTRLFYCTASINSNLLLIIE